MTNLQYRQKKIQEKRKTTPWREFIKEIASWQPNVFYKFDGVVSRFPRTDRIGNVVKYSTFYEQQNEAYIQ